MAGKKPNAEARIRALKDSRKQNGFFCHYSGVKLVEDDPRSSRYLTFDHRTPKREDDIVVCAALINDMKSDMDENEFWNMVAKLLDYHLKQSPPIEEALFDGLRFIKR